MPLSMTYQRAKEIKGIHFSDAPLRRPEAVAVSASVSAPYVLPCQSHTGYGPLKSYFTDEDLTSSA